MQEPTTLLTSKEAAALLRVSTKTLGNWRWKKLIPYVKLNGIAVRYRRSDIEAMIASGVTQRKG